MAFITTFVALGFLVGVFVDFGVSSRVLFFLMLISVMGLLIRVALLPENKKLWSKRELFSIRIHVFFHLLPFSYLLLLLETSPSLSVNLRSYVPLVAFFYTGRRTWRAFFEMFGSKVYKLFYLGNTGMITTLGVLLGLGLLSKEAFFIEFYQRLFMLYFSVHLLIVGAVMIKIENDFTEAKA